MKKGFLNLTIAIFSLCAVATIAHAQTTQCNDGIDNDGDGRIDALIELPAANGQTISVGGGNPAIVSQAVRDAIVSKQFPLTLPVNGRGSQILRADHPIKERHGDEGGTLHLPTLSLVCRVLGYATYVSSTCRDGNGRCNFYSAGNNDMWRNVNGNFQPEGASYKTWISNITCKDRLPACSDGWDNDRDGLVDLRDPDCRSALDNSERPKDPQCTSPAIRSEKEQCSNALDDDSDGLIDSQDPGCWAIPGLPSSYTPTLNNERAATSECQDGSDNDADGATDYPADFSCVTPQDLDETNSKSQCQDGVDNDSDGAIDTNDFSCANKQDNDETNPKAQCQDRIDNDNDGSTDTADFSCSSPQDNDELNPVAQCQDGLDNDRDGAIDLRDFGCATKQDNNEGDANAECQDGVDNDADGAIDLTDFSCSSAQDNDETDPKAQCQDGLDNDGDSAIDRLDFSCATPQDNDEANPKAQCQDGLDNDNDGLTDTQDPGCANNQGNDESRATAQCQDKVDNDNDGAIDFPNDFSCSSKTDSNESDPKAKCQDGIDNDGDGAIDLSDFSCSSNQDDDEANPKSACQDGIDNDGDGLADSEDPGCSNNQDTNEGDETARVTVGVECVTANTDGSTTAYFSYNNTGAQDVAAAIGTSGGMMNEFSPGPRNLGQPTVFKPGLSKGSVVAIFTGPSLTWTLRVPGGGRTMATASGETSPRCAPIQPIGECRGFEAGALRVKLGYQNQNPFTLFIPVGPSNEVTSGNMDRGQPTQFLSGLNKAVFNLDLSSATDTSAWVVNGSASPLASTLPICDGECVDTPTGAITGQLNDIAVQLADAVRDAANLLAAGPATLKSSTKATDKVSKLGSEDRADIARARRQAAEYEARAQSILVAVPSVIKNCPEAPAFCSTVDRGATIEALKGLYAEARNTTKRVVSRAYFRATGRTNRNDPIIRRAVQLEATGLDQLTRLPRFATECK